MKGVTRAAKKASGNSRACAKCAIRYLCICNTEIRKACNSAFVEGFKRVQSLLNKNLKKMAKIKTIELKVKDSNYSININCSKNGVFSCKIPWEVTSVLDIPHEVTGKTLQEVEDAILKAHSDYLKAIRTIRLVVAIQFKANRQFIRDSEYNVFPAFNDKKFLFSEGWGCELLSVLAFGYKIYAEEDINGKKIYHNVLHESKVTSSVKENFEKIGEYYCCSVDSLPYNCELLEYSETLVNNLQSIENQLRNASEFLANLFVSKESMQLLTTKNIKLLTQK